jgi:hypothetical protein
MNISSPEQTGSEPAARKRWEEPCIVIERSLEVSAQGGRPGGPPGQPFGYMGPLTGSNIGGTCF